MAQIVFVWLTGLATGLWMPSVHTPDVWLVLVANRAHGRPRDFGGGAWRMVSALPQIIDRHPSNFAISSLDVPKRNARCLRSARACRLLQSPVSMLGHSTRRRVSRPSQTLSHCRLTLFEPAHRPRDTFPRMSAPHWCRVALAVSVERFVDKHLDGQLSFQILSD
jgi:hypothetical protein